MFDDMIESGATKKKATEPWAVALSLIFQCFLVGIAVLIPLIYTQALPKSTWNMMITAPPPPPPPPPPQAAIKVVHTNAVRLLHNGQLTAPTVIPKQVAMIHQEEMPPEVGVGVEGGVPGGSAEGSEGGVLGGVLGGLPSAAPAPPKPATPTRIRLGGNVQSAKLISQQQPAYPPLARQARIQGNVVLHAIISKDGRIESLTVMSGHPLLIQAALDAVRNWRYQPTLLNGDPVEVDTTITVIFTMAGN